MAVSIPDRIIPFMRYRKVAAILSIALLVLSLASLAFKGLNFGLDFTGGTLVELHYEEPANLETIRESLAAKNFPSAVVVNFGSDRDVLIRMQTTDPKMGDKVYDYLEAQTKQDITLKRVEFVGPQIGDELRDQGGIGMLVALAVVMVYVALRFQFKFSVGAVAALAHDVVIVLGLFSIFQLDFDLTVLAALLAVIGYSLNDTIVVSDRIRENFQLSRERDVVRLIDTSLTQTLGRTLITSLTTLLVLFALLFAGGELIRNFSIGLIIGVTVGTYSSIYVASNMLIAQKISLEDMMEPEKEGEEMESML